MKSITIHGLDDDLDRTIRNLAAHDGLSLNKTIKNLLRRSLGLDDQRQTIRREQFEDLFGTWTKQDIEEFQANTANFSKVDQSDWQ